MKIGLDIVVIKMWIEALEAYDSNLELAEVFKKRQIELEKQQIAASA